ncbi:hypothetical protein [Roseofilum sp. Belize Diploria]|uniref:hypothetical protein n=1 Tax=Roseofilum sp. Belize Diploria TaxID=2821501 RepID=UPI001B029EFC|nr:hypothetical protein [Roseofilum sp. Belize Diploria]MBP0008056.1 hypothetical protein [Roseofilum sp. Belize Diploria]
MDLNPLALLRIRSLCFRALIAISPPHVDMNDKCHELWLLVLGMKRELKSKGKLLIWGECWRWPEGQFMPICVPVTRRRSRTRHFYFE